MIWADMKVYSNHVFVIRESSNHGMQVCCPLMKPCSSQSAVPHLPPAMLHSTCTLTSIASSIDVPSVCRLQVFDLTKLREFYGTPSSRVRQLEHGVLYKEVTSSHNVVINEETACVETLSRGVVRVVVPVIVTIIPPASFSVSPSLTRASPLIMSILLLLLRS